MMSMYDNSAASCFTLSSLITRFGSCRPPPHHIFSSHLTHFSSVTCTNFGGYSSTSWLLWHYKQIYSASFYIQKAIKQQPLLFVTLIYVCIEPKSSCLHSENLRFNSGCWGNWHSDFGITWSKCTAPTHPKGGICFWQETRSSYMAHACSQEIFIFSA